MTSQPPASPALPKGQLDYRHDATFTFPERVPWSELGAQFAELWGRADPANPQPEHMWMIGQNGSGKTHGLGVIFQERAQVYKGTRTQIIVANKAADDTLGKIGFQQARNWDQLMKGIRDGHRAFIFWPRTDLMGAQAKAFHNREISQLLERLWTPESATDVAIDDWGYAEKLPNVRELLEQYLREGRSEDISLTGMKQRPQGSDRLTSSETHWTVAFKPKDRADLERWAELFGARRDWMPVFDSMSAMNREFIIKHNRSQEAYISWMDKPLTPVELPRYKRSVRDFLSVRQGK
jgi:hypothetical protein